MGIARQPLGHPIDVAGEALFEAGNSNFPAANGERVFLGLIVEMLEVDLCSTKNGQLVFKENTNSSWKSSSAEKPSVKLRTGDENVMGSVDM